MKYIVLALAIFITGCSTAPVVMKFPEVPQALMEKCEDLEKVAPGTKQLSTTTEVVIRNYSKYHQCRIKVEEWQEWYNSNKKIYENVK